MSRSVVCPVGITAPESLSSLQRRLEAAEEQSEELMKGLGLLGVSADHLLFNSSAESSSKHSTSPVNIHQALDAGGEGLLWRLCETLVSRVCRLESLLHALKLATFRLETNRELNPSHTARLQEQLNTLQGQYEEEQRSSRREMLRLQDQLQQACKERTEAQQEALRLREVLESTISAKRRQQETAAHLEAVQSHNALLHRVEEMERVVERKTGQMEALEADRQVNRLELTKKKEKILSLERECQQLRDQAGVKEGLISELSKEMKSLKMFLQKQEQENRRLMRDGRDLRAAAADVQVLNNKLEFQCSELNATVQSLTLENTRLQTEYQNNIKAERERVSKHMKEQAQLLDTARRNIHSTVSEKITLKKQLEVLNAEHAKLQQSSSDAQQTAVNHQQMLEQTIERLQEELSCAMREEETRRNERDQIKSEMCHDVALMKKEKNLLETQLSEMKVELSTVNSELQGQEKEKKALMESLAVMQQQQITHGQVEQMLWDLTDSKNKLAYEKGMLQARVQQMEEDLKTLKAECTQHCQINVTLQNSYAQAQRENYTLKEHLLTLQKQHKETKEVVEVLENVVSSHTLLQQNIQTLQTDVHDKTQQLHTLRREKLQAMKEIQKLKAEVEHQQRLTHTSSSKVNEAQMDNRKLAQTLEQLLQDNHNAQEKLNTMSQREAELKEARADIHRLKKHVDSLKILLQREKDLTQQMRKALDEASTESCDLSQANQELREKVSELEKLVSSQKSHLNTETDQNSSKNIRYQQSRVPSSSCLIRPAGHQYCNTNKHLEETLKRLQDERNEAEVRHKEITENTTEDHRDLCSISESSNDESEPQKLRENLRRTDCTPSAADRDKRKTHTCVFDPLLEPWASTLQCWEIKKDMTRIASGYRPPRYIPTPT